MKYVKLCLAVFTVFALAAGVALLTTGGIIAGSANTKRAEIKYQELVYNQALTAADRAYSGAVDDADKKYEQDYAALLISDGVDGHIPTEAQAKLDFNDKNSALVAAKEESIKQAGKDRNDAKADALAKYDRAVLNVKRNFNGTDAGVQFSGTYRTANILTTVKTEENGNGEWSSVTFETVLSPAGKLLVAGMILTLVGGVLGVCVIFSYLGVWERIIENSKKPRPAAPIKEPKQPKAQAKAHETKPTEAKADERTEAAAEIFEPAPEADTLVVEDSEQPQLEEDAAAEAQQ
jgi:hypothetical protein